MVAPQPRLQDVLVLLPGEQEINLLETESLCLLNAKVDKRDGQDVEDAKEDVEPVPDVLDAHGSELDHDEGDEPLCEDAHSRPHVADVEGCNFGLVQDGCIC